MHQQTRAGALLCSGLCDQNMSRSLQGQEMVIMSVRFAVGMLKIWVGWRIIKSNLLEAPGESGLYRK